MQTNSLDGFVCPNCMNPLNDKKNEFECTGCGQYWPIREGIPVFTKRKDIYWNEIPKDEMIGLLNIAKSKDWITAIYDYLKLKAIRDYVIIGDERRADWKYLLPLGKDSIALDLGCGWGAIAVALSKMCGKVYAMDATWERISFLNIRKKQQKIDNLFPIHGGDQLEFPFPPSYFDLISMVGVLEWIGTWYAHGTPHDAQMEALRCVYYHLKNNGYLYIGIENRFGFQYLLGGKDHNGLPFVSILPRFMANLISKRFAGEPYTTYQYSIYGYKKMLQKVGFSEIKFYAPLPQYRTPLFYIPLENVNILNYFFKNIFPLFDMVSPEVKKYYTFPYKVAKIGVKIALLFKLTGLAKFFVPGFSIIAKK